MNAVFRGCLAVALCSACGPEPEVAVEQGVVARSVSDTVPADLGEELSFDTSCDIGEAMVGLSLTANGGDSAGGIDVAVAPNYVLEAPDEVTIEVHHQWDGGEHYFETTKMPVQGRLRLTPQELDLKPTSSVPGRVELIAQARTAGGDPIESGSVTLFYEMDGAQIRYIKPSNIGDAWRKPSTLGEFEARLATGELQRAMDDERSEWEPRSEPELGIGYEAPGRTHADVTSAAEGEAE